MRWWEGGSEIWVNSIRRESNFVRNKEDAWRKVAKGTGDDENFEQQIVHSKQKIPNISQQAFHLIIFALKRHLKSQLKY